VGRTSILTAALFVASCGGSPTSPSPPLASRHLLEVIGFDFSSDPQMPPCDPILLPPGGKRVTTVVTLEREGQSYRARSTTVDAGAVDLEFHETGAPGVPAGRAIAGTARGYAVDSYSAGGIPPKDVRVSFGTASGLPAQVEGTVATSTVFFATGRIVGNLAFSNNQGAFVSNCSAVLWTLQPAGS
jgi:hypothetical protein